MSVKKNLVFSVLLFLSLSGLWAQSTISDSSMVSTQFDMTGFPQWTRDLRRAEIIAFGSFPFMYFFTNLSYDTYRFATHNWDRRYAPWPMKGAGAVETSQREKLAVIGIAAGGAVLVALIDFTIVKVKRNRAEKEIRNLPPGSPIIIQKPLYADEDSGSAGNETPPQAEDPGTP